MLTLLLSCVVFLYLSIAAVGLLLILEPFKHDDNLSIESKIEHPSWSELLTTALFWPVTLYLLYRVSPLNSQNFELADTRIQEPKKPQSRKESNFGGQKREKLS